MPEWLTGELSPRARLYTLWGNAEDMVQAHALCSSALSWQLTTFAHNSFPVFSRDHSFSSPSGRTLSFVPFSGTRIYARASASTAKKKSPILPIHQRHSSCFEQLEEGELLRAAADARDMEKLVAQGASGSARAGIALTLMPSLVDPLFVDPLFVDPHVDTFATWVFFSRERSAGCMHMP